MSNCTFSTQVAGYLFQVFDTKPNFKVLETNQIHGNNVLQDTTLSSNLDDADGIFSFNLTIPLATKTADCLPIVIIGDKGVALLHAGWRGVQQRIIQNLTVSSLEPHTIFIGPHIQHHHFEVQKDFQVNFPESNHFNLSNGKLTFNLAAEVIDQVKKSYPKVKTDACSLSTYDDHKFHSFRRDGTKQRNWNILSKTK